MGATQPSLAALVIAFSVIAGITTAICLYVTPDFMGSDESRLLLANETDDQTQVTRIVLGLGHEETPVVMFLGDSLTKGCIANEQIIADLVARESGQKVRVYNTSTDAQTIWEMAAILDHLPSGFNGVFVIGLSLYALQMDVTTGDMTLVRTLEHPRLGITSEGFENEVRIAGLKPPLRTGIYALDNVEFLLARRRVVVRNLIKGPPSYGDPLDHPWYKNPQEFWEEYRRREQSGLPHRIEYYESNVHTNLAVVERFVSKLKARGDASFILLEPPMNPSWFDDPTGADLVRNYQSDLRGFATEHGMSYLPITSEAAFVPDDFLDYAGHFANRVARDRCTRVLASSVSETLTAHRAQLRQ